MKGRTGPAFPKIGKMMVDLPSRAARRGNTVIPMIIIQTKGRSGPASPKIGKMLVDLSLCVPSWQDSSTNDNSTNERPQRARIPEDRRNDGPSPRGADSRGNTVVLILTIRMKGRSGPAFAKIG